MARNAAIKTVGTDGLQNGRLITVWNAIERPDLRPEQVYVTTVFPNMTKGPHLHMKRRGLFCCVRGDVKIVLKIGDKYEEHFTGESHGYAVVEVPPGIPNAIVSVSYKESFVLNMPSPAWSTEDPDDWTVEGWDYVG